MMPVPDTFPIVGFYKLGVSLGDGGKPQLIRAMRGQANFVEYVPYAFLVMMATATAGTPGFVLHIFGVFLTLGRLLHAWHFTRGKPQPWMRGVGTGLTMLTLIFGSVGLIGHALFHGL
jgi:uncharacterized protein